MAPLLIDGRDLLKFGIISVLGAFLVFSAGFLTGYQRAETSYQAGSDSQSLSLPATVNTVQVVTDVQAPDTIEAGAEIDVDKPVTKIKTDVPQAKKLPGSKNTDISPESVSSSNNTSSKKNIFVTKKSVTDKSLKKTVSDKNSASIISAPVTEETNNPAQASIIMAFTRDKLSDIKYSVQIGMYVRLVNAENMMKMLQAQKYDAYVTDYTNKNDEIRYNVRFGYFTDKKSALEKLRKFKAGQKSDGYLVRFTADNIVKTADAVELKQLPDAPEYEKNTDKNSIPVTPPLLMTDDKISQADISSPIDVLSNRLTGTN